MRTDSSPAALSSHLLQLSVLELLTRNSPFTHVRSTAVCTLSDLLADYIRLLASTAKLAAEEAGRAQVSVWDVGLVLEHTAPGRVTELFDELHWCQKGIHGALATEQDARLDEARKAEDFVVALRDVLCSRVTPECYDRLRYDTLYTSEVVALNSLADNNKVVNTDDAASSPGTIASESDSMTSYHSGPEIADVKIEDQELSNLLVIDGSYDEKMISAWRETSLVPDYVPDFLPPFPGMGLGKDINDAALQRQHATEPDDRAGIAPHRAARADAALRLDPWTTPIAYADSMSGEMSGSSALPPALQANPNKRRRRAPTPPPTSSLQAFRAVAEPTALVSPQWTRANSKRRSAASAISMSSDMSLANDSLFGSVPVSIARNANLTPGFLPEQAPPKVHPFNTPLPHTIATPVPAHPSPGPALIAPPGHARIPSVMRSIVAQLAQPTSPHLQLFSRLMRMGPPGPLGPKGEAIDYEYIGQTSLIMLNVEWPQRAHDRRLAAGERDEEAGTGIKLNLRLARGDSQPASSAASPVSHRTESATPIGASTSSNIAQPSLWQDGQQLPAT